MYFMIKPLNKFLGTDDHHKANCDTDTDMRASLLQMINALLRLCIVLSCAYYDSCAVRVKQSNVATMTYSKN